MTFFHLKKEVKMTILGQNFSVFKSNFRILGVVYLLLIGNMRTLKNIV